MPRESQNVYKFNEQGVVIREYQSIKAACKAEKVGPPVLYKAIEHRRILGGFMYTFDPRSAVPFDQNVPFFDVEEFGRYYDTGKWNEESSIQPVKMKMKW